MLMADLHGSNQISHHLLIQALGGYLKSFKPNTRHIMGKFNLEVKSYFQNTMPVDI